MDTNTPPNMNPGDRAVSLLILGAAGTLFFIFVFALFVYSTTKHLMASRDMREHSQEILSTLQTVSQRLDRIDFASRLYLAEKDDDDLTLAQSNAISLDSDLIHLSDLVRDNESQLDGASRLQRCVFDLKQQVNENLPQRISPHAKVLECRDDAGKIQMAERSLLTERTSESQQGIYRSLLAGGGFLAVSMVVVVVLFYFLLRDARNRHRLNQQIFNTNSQMEVTVLTLQKRAAEAALLTAAREELQLCTTTSQAHHAVVRYCTQLLPSVNAAIFTINNSRNMVELVAASNKEIKLLDGFPLDACCGLRSGRLRWRKPGESEVHCEHFIGAPPENYLCIPLAAHGETIGVLYIECPTELIGVDVSRNKESLEELVEIASMSIAGLNLRARLEQQSIRDSLTGLYNRHLMELALDREIRRAARNHADLSVLMLDVDHFKQFNDTYGHEAGDSVLRHVADIFRRIVRETDVICRYGGEEFVVILPDTNAEAAIERAESIREEVRRMRIRFHGEMLREITTSIGVAVYPTSGETLEELLRAADRALYTAKHSGRNQVVMAHPVAAQI